MAFGSAQEGISRCEKTEQNTAPQSATAEVTTCIQIGIALSALLPVDDAKC